MFPIFLPPLRDRKDDILLLADHFVAKYARKMGKEVRRISTPAINMMFAYHWPGNVRELENCIEYAVLLSTDGVIHGQTCRPRCNCPQPSKPCEPGLLKARVRIAGTRHDHRRLEELPREREHGRPSNSASRLAWSATRSRNWASTTACSPTAPALRIGRS